MKTTLLDLFTSKKFLAAVSAVAIYIAGRFGFDLDPAALDRIFAAFLVYVGAQGVADAGKSAALIRAAAPANDNQVANQVVIAPRAAQAGRASLLAMALIAIGGVAALALGACHAPEGSTIKTAERIGLKCTAPEMAIAVNALIPLANSAVLAAATFDGKALDASKLREVFSAANVKTDLGSALACAASEALAAIMQPAAPNPSAPLAAGLAVDPAAARAAFEELRAERFPGVPVATSRGVL